MIVVAVDEGENKSMIAERFGIPRSTLSTILKNRNRIPAVEYSGKQKRKLNYRRLKTVLFSNFTSVELRLFL